MKRNEQPRHSRLDEAKRCSPLACQSYAQLPATHRARPSAAPPLSALLAGIALIVAPPSAVVAKASSVFAETPAAVAANIFGRVAALVVRIKNHPGYTEAIGQDLGVIGAEETVDLHSLKPALKLTLQAGRPVGWTKQGLDGVEIWVDRGTGTFAFLAIDAVPDYLDTAPLPAPGAGAVWKYKAIYRLNDEPVGQSSDVASLSVMG